MDGSDSERSQKLFRKVALARLSSPDRLDALLGIDRPNVQLGVIGAAILLTAFVVWGFVWRFEQKVAGRCILTSPSGIAEVTASAGGVVGGLTAKLGERVVAGKPIGRILRPELDDQIRAARERLTELERRRDEINRFGSRSGAQGQSAALAERKLFEAQIRLAEDKARAIEKRLVTERDLVAQGLITRRTLLDSEEAHAAAILEREQLVDRAAQAKLGFPSRSASASVSASLSIFRSMKRGATSMRRSISSASRHPVVSAFGGRVVEIKIGNGVVGGIRFPRAAD
jgi:HlyD family secretion protein